MTNLALSCAGCNLSKASNIAGLDDETGELARLFNPRTDVWIDHFARVEAKIVGISAIGRSTVGVLNMNQPERIRLRALLIRLGVLSPN